MFIGQISLEESSTSEQIVKVNLATKLQGIRLRLVAMET